MLNLYHMVVNMQYPGWLSSKGQTEFALLTTINFTFNFVLGGGGFSSVYFDFSHLIYILLSTKGACFLLSAMDEFFSRHSSSFSVRV